MKRRLTKRLIFDVAMLILLLCAYAYRVIGDAAHEWIGIFVCALFIAHNVINRRWYNDIFKGGHAFRRTFTAIVNILLAFSILTLLVTGLSQSRTILAFLHSPGDALLRRAHTTAAYWCLPLIGVHIGLHWEMIKNVFRKTTCVSGSSPVRMVIFRTLSVMIVAFGVYASFDRDMGSKLFLGYSFDFWNPNRPAILFFAYNLAIMGVYVFATYYFFKLLSFRRKVKNGAGAKRLAMKIE
ncbi:MAG: DUF4405 domain-containing protein [Deltaproteobacteria bacterium]|jgi:hypothetical protein|nr:DUF4405 domain-containing protein [Deltaproteobacteria bacterium]